MSWIVKVAQVIIFVVALLGCAPAAAPVAPGAPASAAEEGCVAACARLQTCAGAPVSHCREDCTADLTTESSGRAYQACVEQLSCIDIQRSLVMNEGPLGRCFKSALGR